MRPIKTHLPDKESLSRFLSAPPPDWNDSQWHTKSDWLIALIDEIEATGQYPYNTTVQREAEKRLGLPRQNDNGSALSVLVYTAQVYRREARDEAEGWHALTQNMIEEAYRREAQIEIRRESVLLAHVVTRLTVREINGQRYAFEPRRRKYAIRPAGQDARIVGLA